MKFYPIKDRLNADDFRRLQPEIPRVLGLNVTVPGIFAIRVGVKRPPKKGEWYISGAIPEAYRAKDDMDSSYLIAKLVKTTLVRKILAGDCKSRN